MTKTNSIARKIMVGAVAAMALFAGTSVTAEAATPRNGKCEMGEVCFYYNSNYQGSVSDFNTSVADYGTTQPKCYDFKGEGAGKGKCIKNQVASVRNLTGQPVTIYYNSNYDGSRASQTIAAGASANLNSTMKNNNASHLIGKANNNGGGSTGSFGTPGVNPHPSASTKAPKATARTQFVDDAIAKYTGMTRCWVGSYRSWERPTSNHNTGNALDCTVSSAIGKYPTASEKAFAWKVSKWLQQHAKRLKVRYIMFDGKIWSVARASEGWRNHPATGVTAGHHDHIHISIENPHGD